ncbi:unnamed protein product [Arabis nemorensis]|uniref:Uncharacterized protein n=1 Tax=Arabis nemorensis TaxID=586526 RepID=A0A565CTK1_9BRAS|nr:unnamed protein product [Arabis nemorensis]
MVLAEMVFYRACLAFLMVGLQARYRISLVEKLCISLGFAGSGRLSHGLVQRRYSIGALRIALCFFCFVDSGSLHTLV